MLRTLPFIAAGRFPAIDASEPRRQVLPVHRLADAARVVQLWAARRRERQTLAELSDHMLRDIGVSRAEAQGESAKPFWRR